LSLVGRSRAIFDRDLERHSAELAERVRGSSFLVLGGAGSIGQAVVKALFERAPGRLDVVDVSENNLVELVRDIRSSSGYIEGEFRTLPLDIGQAEFEAFIEASGRYDYVLNLSALKHVRSEKDPYTLMRMLAVNVLNTVDTLRQAAEMGADRYFAVSSDKAANPANAMGASKRVMELCLTRASRSVQVSSARFANVAFSDGSLLHGFSRRLAKRQPLSAPEDVYRYFITDSEAAVLCLMSCLLGANREAFFPSLEGGLDAIDFRTIAERFLDSRGLRAHPCATEDEARGRVEELAARGAWPCYFFSSDTTGEKEIEEFTMAGEEVDVERFDEIGVVRWPELEHPERLDRFVESIRDLRDSGRWTRRGILRELKELVPEFQHLDTGKYLDSRM
jgi:FlaA1/EpsC-like NDP-sugar epimerase